MTSKKCFKYNHPSKPYGWFDLNHFSWAGSGLKWSVSSVEALPEGISSPYIEDIQVFGVNMSFISLSEVKNFYIS